MEMNRRNFVRALAGVALLGGTTGAFAADDYPNSPVHLVVPYPPGSATDTGGRIVAEALSSILGQTVVVENRGGASGTVGSTYVAGAEPDGYTLLLGNTATHGAPREMFPDLPYDPIDSFEPVTNLYRNIIGLAVHESFPASTFEEFVEHVRANPGTIGYGIPGYGTVQQLAGAVLSQTAELEMEHIPYNGGGPLVVDLVGGHIPVGITAMAAATEFYRAGRIKILAILSSDRVEGFEEIPTVAETYPGFDFAGWGGLFVPRGTDEAIVDKLNAAVREAYEDPEVSGALQAVGLVPLHSTPEELTERITMLLEGWQALSDAGVQITE